MTFIPQDPSVPPGAATMVPGPRGAVLRALPACALGIIGTPTLALLAPHDGRDSLWSTAIIVLVLVLMFGIMMLDRRRLPHEPPGGDALPWQKALASARRHRTVPELPDVRLMATRASYNRLWSAGLLWCFLAGLGCAALVRPDLSWFGALGGLLVVALLTAARVPSAWAYLTLNDAASQDGEAERQAAHRTGNADSTRHGNGRLPETVPSK